MQQNVQGAELQLPTFVAIYVSRCAMDYVQRASAGDHKPYFTKRHSIMSPVKGAQSAPIVPHLPLIKVGCSWLVSR